MAIYNQKIIITDTLTRIYHYEGHLFSGFTKNREKYEKGLYGEKSDASLRRAKDNLALTIAANVTKRSKFITITVKENMTNRAEFLLLFNKFRERATRYLGRKMEYAAVTETQKRGAWHIHMILFNVPEWLDIKKFNEKTFPEGNLNIKQVREYWNLFKYLTKYLTKEELCLNKKAVLKSYGLRQPTISYDSGLKVSLENTNPDYKATYKVYHGLDEFGRERFTTATVYEYHTAKEGGGVNV